MGDDFQLLKLGLIPRLRFLIGEPVQEALWSGKVIRARTGGGGDQNVLNRSRLVALLPKLIGAISTLATPELLFLDELQWVDEANLALLKDIARDKQISSLLLVCCYRSNEVDVLHPLTTLLGELTIFGVPVNGMHLE